MIRQKSGHGDMLESKMIIKTYFGRGNDELVNRAFKDFRAIARCTLIYR